MMFSRLVFSIFVLIILGRLWNQRPIMNRVTFRGAVLAFEIVCTPVLFLLNFLVNCFYF